MVTDRGRQMAVGEGFLMHEDSLHLLVCDFRSHGRGDVLAGKVLFIRKQTKAERCYLCSKKSSHFIWGDLTPAQ